MAGNRYKSLDVFKGFAIIAIVFVHMFVEINDDVSGPPSSNAVVEIAYIGLMLFFIMSGFFFKEDRGFLENVKKRAIQLAVLWIGCVIVLPFLLWCYVNALGKQPVDISEYFNTVGSLLTLGSGGLVPYVERMSDNIGILYMNAGYYFIESLFFGLILFYAVGKWSSKNWNRAIPVIIALITATFLLREFTDCRCVFSIQLAPLAAAFALIGYMAKKHNVYEYIETQWKTARYWIVFAVCLAAAVAFAIFLPTGLEFVQTRFAPWALHDEWYYNLRIYTFVAFALVACYVLLVLASMFSKLKISCIFSFVGQHTLGILMLHCFVIKIISATFFNLPPHDYFPIEITENMPIVIGLVAIAISIGISVLASKALKAVMKKRNGSPQKA